MEYMHAVRTALFTGMIQLFLLTASSFGQSADSTVLVVHKTRDFACSGDTSAAGWQRSSWLVLPKRNQNSVYYQTKMKLLYSDSGIYCLYYCQDSVLTSTLREDFSDLYNEDVVEAFFWTDESVPIYFEYELSPFNYELAILVPNLHGNYLGWRPWHYEGDRKTRHATHVFNNNGQVVGWVAEFFIPFKLLKPMNHVPPLPGSHWRANFYRIDYDKKASEWSWQSTRVNFHDYERFGVLLFE
jgi:hypothetical protein